MRNKIFARRFRGFEEIEIELDGINFLVGDNSSGKSSILHLIYAVLNNDLNTVPSLKEDLGVGRFDYFSPFCDMQDVIFGFSSNKDQLTFSKVITVSSKANGIPEVTRCSYFFEGQALSIRKSGRKLSRRISQFGATTSAELIEHHQSDIGFETFVSKMVPTFEISQQAAIVMFFRKEELVSEGAEGSTSLAMFLFGPTLPSSSFVGPIRSLPAKYYEQLRKISPLGLHFASMWYQVPKAKQKKYFSRVDKFGLESGLFDTLRVQSISKKVKDSPLLVLIERSGKSFLLNQVGVGISQVAPVLMEAITAAANPSSRVALFQQPELHLHPIAQAALGSFFHELAQDGFVGFLETHSNFLIDRFRSDIKSATESNGLDVSANVIFCSTSESGNRMLICPISNLGEITGAPDQYYDFFLSESIRSMI